jgi:hypothetical protein
MKHLIATMDNDELCDLIEQAISEGKNVAPDHDPDRKYAEAWIRGWCYERTTQSFKEAAVIYLHNHIVT